jgi:hypothetical protein
VERASGTVLAADHLGCERQCHDRRHPEQVQRGDTTAEAGDSFEEPVVGGPQPRDHDEAEQEAVDLL